MTDSIHEDKVQRCFDGPLAVTVNKVRRLSASLATPTTAGLAHAPRWSTWRRPHKADEAQG
jgi:hypothetical protein